MASAGRGRLDEDREALRTLTAQLKHLRDGAGVGALLRTLEDLLLLAYSDHAAQLFPDEKVHLPLLVVLDSYLKAASVQQVGWSLLCKLIEVCPNTLQSLTGPRDVGRDWEVLGVHQLILKMLTVHHSSMSLCTVGLKALELLLNSGKITLLILDEESDVFLLIFEAMRSFFTSVEVQKLGCKVLHMLFERVSEEQLTEFVENKDYVTLLDALSHFREDEDVVLPVLQCLNSLAVPCSNVEVLMSGNVRCYNIAVEAMKVFPDTERIQEVGCCLLHRLALGNFFNILVLNDVHRFVVTALQRFPENAALQMSALSCLALLTETIFLNQDLEDRSRSPSGAQRPEEPLWLEASCAALTRHRRNKHVQEAACWALSNLLLHRQSLHQKIGDEDGQFPAHREVMLSMLMYPSSKGVFQAAAHALSTLLAQNVHFRKVLLSKGIFLNVLELMQRHSLSADVAKSGCKMLNHLFEGSHASLDTAMAVVPRVLSVMRSHETAQAVQLEALCTLLHFLAPAFPEGSRQDAEDQKKLTVFEKHCMKNEIHKLVLAALNRFISCPGIQRCGLRVISWIAGFPEEPEVLALEGAVDSVLHTLQMYPDDHDIQCLGLCLIRHLVTKKNLCIGTGHLLAKILVSSLQRFSNSADLQTEGFQTVLRIQELWAPFSKLLLQHRDLPLVLFRQMTASLGEPRNQQLLCLACKCFARLTLEQGLKGQLLETACELDDADMVQCLLLLGADANSASESGPLICQVCEKACSPQLVQLLLDAGSREQDVRAALAVSLGRGDGQVISLLLRRLGLDLASSSLCLGGLGLGSLQPSWLGPLFPARTPSARLETSLGSTLARMVLRLQSMMATEDGAAPGSEDMPDKMDEWTFLPEPFVDSVFIQSEDVDSEGSEDWCLGKKKSHPISAGERSLGPAWLHCSPAVQRHSSSLGPASDHEVSLKQKRKLLPSDDCVWSPRAQPTVRAPDGTSSACELEQITSLDLSANELHDVDVLGQAVLRARLEPLQRLELQQNLLASFPLQLCETLRCLTYLDLHSNRFPSFPPHLLKMNRLASLDVSRNDIGPLLALSPTSRCPSLRQLNLSYNQLSALPQSLGATLEKLEQLLLEGNKISEIGFPLNLKELKTLNLSKNYISSLPEDFFEACLKMESFSARMNLLSTMPLLPSSVTSLKLSHNRFTCIPEAILNLPHLRSVDMSSNSLQVLPGPARWRSLSLRELLFSHNQIGSLDLREKPHAWSRLEKLHLSHNRLKEIPPEIGCLENLTSLDVSYNMELRSFPNEMGKLSKIWDLPLDDLRLNFDFKHIGYKAKDIIRFLQQRLKKAVPYNRMKLMVVGNAGSGKTTLLQQLMKARKSEPEVPGATVGIDVKDWPVQIRGRGRRDLTLNVWDFAGQEEFFSTHPHFMTPRALYLAVYDLSKGPGEVDAMKAWLFNIKARASSSPVILVGTHLDVSDEKQRRACVGKITQELLHKRGFPAVRDYHFVNATEESDALSKLRKTIIHESLNFKIQDQPVVGQLVPDCYVALEKIILSERKNVPLEFPVIGRQRLLQLVDEQQLQLEENELPHAVRFLNDSGVLLHFQDPALQLSDLYFVEPKWLCKVMAQILTVKVEGCPKHPKGIISRRDVEKFLSKKKRFPKNYMSQYFKLLEKFQIALPIGEEYLLVPSSLSDHRPVIELPHCENSEVIVRLYEMPYFPMGFWSRLISRLLEISPYMLSGRERALRPNRMYWRQGIYLNWSPEAYCLVGAETPGPCAESILKVTVPSCRKGCILLGHVVDHVDSLMEEWFPGLLEMDVCGEGETLLKKWALYSFSDAEQPRRILLDDLAQRAEQGDLLVSPDDPRLTVPISQIAPDLTLADLPRSIMLNSEELEFQQAPEFLLGDGSFGSVYRASYEGEEVAVKIFNKHTSLRLLRQELVVLCHLHHPSLVSLLAAGVRPRLLVMELASRGSLDRLLRQESGLPRALQHRVALHVADGLRYLHSAMIIYRDLKPHNVLLFTLYPNAAIIAKIADYGIAQYCCRMGIQTSEGTPGFRAPEVARGNVIYNQQADVYSLGLLLYDILTNGSRITEGLKFPNEFDELAIQGKLPDPVKEYGCAPWPMVENLIEKCLKENPQERPTAAQVFDILNSPELICLMRLAPLPSNLLVECMATSSQSGSPGRVWLGCGLADRGHVLILDLNAEGLDSEEVADSRILSLVLVHLPTEGEVWAVCGTQSGTLLAINTEDRMERRALQSMGDSVTCLHCTSFSKQSKQKNFLLVGTANGKLAIFEDTSVKCEGAAPWKMLSLGDVSTPLTCLSESLVSAEKGFTWGACGTKVFALSSDFAVQKLVETRTGQLFSYRTFSDSSILALAVDSALYVAKKNSPFVEVWDKKTERLCQLVDCALFLKEEMVKVSKDSRPRMPYCGRVKTLCLQKNTALWVGTGGGHILLLDLPTRRVLRVIHNFCDSVRVMMAAQAGNLKNVMLVLGYSQKTTEDMEHQKELQSCLSVWDINLPHEVQNLDKHIEMRKELAEKMRRIPLE